MDKILIVDDSLLQSKMLAEILHEDYRVEIVRNSMNVIQWAEEFQPSLILLDIVMPRKSGFEVLTDIKNSSTLNSVPVILITSLTDVENEEKGLVLGAVDYITKPFNKLIVKARIQTHIQLYNYRRAIERMAMIDALTGLPNRRAYDEYIKKEWENASDAQYPLAIALLDIDFFKQYNDNFGHPAGDALLKKISGIFREHLEKEVDFAARYGGEEFIFLFPHSDSRHAASVCEGIRASVENLAEPNYCPTGESTHVTVSLGGITVRPQLTESYEDYVEEADQMLYQAKKMGRNQVLWKECGACK